MPTLAPWLTPPDYLAAMRSGAGIGLNLRQQDLAEQEAADRLRESYAHLSSQENIASQQLQASQKQQEAAMALRAQQASALENYRQQEIANAKQRMADAEAEKNKPDKPTFHFGTRGQVLKLGPDGNVDVVREADPKDSPPTPPGSIEYDESGNIKTVHGAPDSSAVKFLQDKLAKDKAIEGLPKRGFHPTDYIPSLLGGKSVPKKLTRDQAKQFLDAAGGDKDKARELARQDGWEF